MKKKVLLIGAGAALAVGAYLVLRSRKSIPKGAVPFKPFDKERYMGHWYEIARLDYRHEKNLSNTEAEYSINEDGSIKVINSGFNLRTRKQETVTGKAKFAGSSTEGKLKVSFWGPFYSGYNVLAIDRDYKYALVAGKDLNYLWLLSRDTTMPEHIREEYLNMAKDLGYEVSRLVWVSHN